MDAINEKEILDNLYFGNVDSESEQDLDSKFIKTKDFFEFITPQKALILGAKGSGKSALFQMFAKYEESAVKLAGLDKRSTFIITGTGFNDVKELQTDDFNKLLKEPDANFDQIWELYIAVKIAIKLGKEGYYVGDNLTEFYKKAGIIEDFRILPILKQLWGVVIGTPPQGLDIDYRGLKLKIGGKHSIDTQDMLVEINDFLEDEDKECWVLFDKIDELFSDDYEKRKSCIQSLFRIYLKFVNRFPRIKFKIFLRKDIWATLEFVNKSHISDKCVELTWTTEALLEMLLKRALANEKVLEYVSRKTNLQRDELFLKSNVEMIFYSLFDRKVYKGKKEADVISWIMSRITDGLGGKYPRELINLGNYAKDEQINTGIAGERSLIGGSSIKNAFIKVSQVKCDTYLSEFPTLRKHFEKFQGKDKAQYSRQELIILMEGLEPKGDDMIRALYETGMLEPKQAKSYGAEEFEIPKLFRTGLGLALRGRL
ncbi:P-loop ATPase, Sll1717 family [Faecalicatena contorta]|uniref:P-loop ATPase, Sll1717 family n=1 Tax=Faecalicatena contorta TaxID=39482 RepID=UPI00189BAE1B|nr:hypothetical protein [Faecalicatena contorta]